MILLNNNVFSSSAILYHIEKVFDICTKYMLAASSRAKEDLTKSGINIKGYLKSVLKTIVQI